MCGRDRGASALEYVALLAVAALIIGGLVSIGIPDRVHERVGTAVCEILGGPDCGQTPETGDQPEGAQRPGAGQQPGDGPRPHIGGRSATNDGCHGILDCTWSGVTDAAEGAVGGVVDTLGGLKQLVTTNPLTTVGGLGKYLWDKTGGAWFTAVGACTSGDWETCKSAGKCTLLGAQCILEDMLFDDKVDEAIANNDWGSAIGRLAWNTASFFIPTKIPGLNRLGGILKGTEEAGKISAALQHITDELANARKASEAAGRDYIPPSTWQELLHEYTGLNAADRTKFLDGLTAEEFKDLIRTTDDVLRADVMEHLSPKQAAALYESLGPDLKSDLLQHASPETLAQLKPNPRAAPGTSWYPFKGKLFDGEPKLSDVAQGEFGTCWCLSAMAELAQQAPGKLKSLIRENPNGTYTITFGDGYKVTVTGDLPVGSARTSPAGWPAILEKAVAERYGGYGPATGGFPDLAFQQLTGKPSAVFTETKPSLNSLSQTFREGYLYAVSFPESAKMPRIPNAPERGIVPNHAYAVVAVDRAAGTITLANPHGPTAKVVTLTEAELDNPEILLSEGKP